MDKILVFLADGFEEIEALTIVDYLRRAGVDLDTVSVMDKHEVVGSHNITIKADILIDDINKDDYKALYIPGGTKGALNLRDNEKVIDLVKDFNKNDKLIAAICAGPIVLDRAGVLYGKSFVSFPTIDSLNKKEGFKEYELVVKDGNIITSRGAGASIYLALDLVKILKGDEALEDLKSGIQQDFVEDYFDFKY